MFLVCAATFRGQRYKAVRSRRKRGRGTQTTRQGSGAPQCDGRQLAGGSASSPDCGAPGTPFFVPGETEQRAPADQHSYSVSVGRASSVGLWAVSDAICSTNGPETGCHPQPEVQQEKNRESCTLAPPAGTSPLLGDSSQSLTEFQKRKTGDGTSTVPLD